MADTTFTPVYAPDTGPRTAEQSPEMLDLWDKADTLNQERPGQGTWVPIRAIVIRPELALRDRLNESVVTHYATILDALPPIKLQGRDAQDATYVRFEGAHRYEAASRVRDFIRVEFVDIPDDELYLAALRANATHGLPLTMDDRRRAVGHLIDLNAALSDDSDDKLTDDQIARECGVSRKTVWTYRTEIEKLREREAQQATATATNGSAPAVAPRPAAEVLMEQDGRVKRRGDAEGGGLRARPTWLDKLEGITGKLDPSKELSKGGVEDARAALDRLRLVDGTIQNMIRAYEQYVGVRAG